jgi:hypothetical protein
MVRVIDTESEAFNPPERLLATVVDSLAIECRMRRFQYNPESITQLQTGKASSPDHPVRLTPSR